MDIERPAFARIFVQLQARFKQKKRTRMETEQEMSKGRTPKVPVRQECQINWSALIHIQKVQCQKGILMRLLAPTRMLTM